MSAFEMQARAVRRLGCTVNLVKRREFTARANQTEAGLSCAECGECVSGPAEVGVVDAGVYLMSDASGLSLKWSCPACGRDVTEATTLLSSFMLAREVSGDALCCKCRKAGSWSIHSNSLGSAE